MNRQFRCMPTARQIRLHWSTTDLPARKGFSLSGSRIGRDICFACVMEVRHLERCHISPRCNGGSDSPSNLHLLCSVCHEDSERFEDEAYWARFWERSAPDMLLSLAARAGMNIWAVLNSPTVGGDIGALVRILRDAHAIMRATFDPEGD
jgi:hypothetical protein